MAAESALVGELIWGPIALLVNIIEHGFPPGTPQGFIETFASAIGTALWAAVAMAIAGVEG